MFKLTLAQFREITSRPCFYCNDYGSPRGLDRRQNSQGYLPENCVAACGWCNRTKSADSEETFLGHIWKVALHQQRKKRQLVEAQQVMSLAGDSKRAELVVLPNAA